MSVVSDQLIRAVMFCMWNFDHFCFCIFWKSLHCKLCSSATKQFSSLLMWLLTSINMLSDYAIHTACNIMQIMIGKWSCSCLFTRVNWFVAFSQSGADTSDVMEKINKELECPICWGRLSQPKLLPCCQHTFCLDCISSHVKGSAGGRVSCPVCRKLFRLPHRGVAALENNSIANRLLEITKNG